MTYVADIGGILGGLASLMALCAALRKWARKRRNRRMCHGLALQRGRGLPVGGHDVI